MTSVTPHRFNASGQQDRDCPVCLRVGSLTGDRAEGATLECTGGMGPGRSGDLTRGGCCARFTFHPGDAVTPATLTRVPLAVLPLRPLYLHLQEKAKS